MKTEIRKARAKKKPKLEIENEPRLIRTGCTLLIYHVILVFVTATAHALVGGAIASSVHNPALGISLALLSHPLLDMVPHWDFGKGWRQKSKSFFLAEGVFDLAVGLFASYLIFGQYINLTYFLVVVFASLFFDLMMTPYWFLKWKFPPFSWAYKFGSSTNGDAPLPWGIVTQLVAVIGVTVVLKFFS